MRMIIFFVTGLFITLSCSTSSNVDKINNQITNSEEIVDPSFYQEKFFGGIDFFARGNEPFWNLEIDFEKEMKFSTMDDFKLITPAIKGVKTQDADVTLYQAATEAGELKVTVTKSACSDNMSGEKFNYKVIVEVKQSSDKDFKTFEGCGKYLYDYRLYDIWVMEEMTGVELNKNKLMKGLPTFEFNLADMRFGGHAGCNNLSGKIDVVGSKITFGNIISTMMACPDMTVEKAVVKALDKNTFTYKIEKMKLTLTNDDGVKMILKKVD
jgi:heat shock protein HslJ/uncharacterized membrane protein